MDYRYKLTFHLLNLHLIITFLLLVLFLVSACPHLWSVPCHPNLNVRWFLGCIEFYKRPLLVFHNLLLLWSTSGSGPIWPTFEFVSDVCHINILKYQMSLLSVEGFFIELKMQYAMYSYPLLTINSLFVDCGNSNHIYIVKYVSL